ncbi:MAG TPA: hypothetical protein VGC92_12950 [Phenylobacterium sp.]|jgi:hypothetical protein
MADYRLYYLDRRGHIGGVRELICADDADAVEQALAHADGRAMELWNRDRQVRSFPADAPSGSPARDRPADAKA